MRPKNMMTADETIIRDAAWEAARSQAAWTHPYDNPPKSVDAYEWTWETLPDDKELTAAEADLFHQEFRTALRVVMQKRQYILLPISWTQLSFDSLMKVARSICASPVMKGNVDAFRIVMKDDIGRNWPHDFDGRLLWYPPTQRAGIVWEGRYLTAWLTADNPMGALEKWLQHDADIEWEA